MVPYNQMKANQLPPFIQLKNADGTIDTYYSIFYDGVSNEVKNIARTELNETEENKQRGIQRLREVLKEEGITGVDDQLLLCCLRKCKYNFNKAESQVLKYLKTRSEILTKLRKADLKRLEHVLDHMVVGLLPYRDKKGRAIFFTTPNINLQLFDLEDASLCYFLILSFILNSSSRMTSITGVVYIGEVKTPSMDIMYPIMKTFQRDLGRITSFPGRIAKIEILNEIFIVRWTVNLIKPLLPTKSVERSHEDESSSSSEEEVEYTEESPISPEVDSERADKIRAEIIDMILDCTVPPRRIERNGKPYILRLSRQPPNRDELMELSKNFEEKLRERQVRMQGYCPIRRELYDQLFDELIRQSTIFCHERGQLLLRVRDEFKMTLEAYQKLFENGIEYGTRKALEAEMETGSLRLQHSLLKEEVERAQKKIKDLKAEIEAEEKQSKHRVDMKQLQHEEKMEFLRKINKQLKEQKEMLSV